MLLSIGMIVKNEEKYLDRCLTALHPILEQVDSELIIADTGSTDKTVEIAKKHTDNVFYFEWINDFGAARNSTLERAKGEWFMFVDADEIFTDCSEIISFFNSGLYKKYDAATFIQRNYTSKDMLPGTFGDFNAPRICRLDPDIRFELPIHEGYNRFGPNIKILNSAADHYGYIHDDDENTARKKCERNQPLLLKRLETEKNPKSLLFMQLFEAFFETDREKSLEYLEMGRKRSLEEKSCMVAAFYKKFINYEFVEKNYEKAIEYCDEYLNMEDKDIKPGLTGSDGEFTSFKAHILDIMGRYSDAVSEYVKFFRLYRDYCNGKLDTKDLMMYELHYLPKDKFHLNHREFLRCCIKSGKYNTALEYLKVLPLDKCPDEGDYITERIRSEVVIAENTNYKNLAALASQVPEKYKEIFYRLIRARLFLSDDKSAYAKKLLSVVSSESFRRIMELINAFVSGERVESEKIKEFASEYGTAKYPELLYMLIAQNMDISPLTAADDFSPANLSFSCCTDYEGFYKYLESYDVNVCVENCFDALAAVIQTAIIRAEGEKLSAEGLLRVYGRLGMRMNADAEDESVPKETRGAAAAGNIISCFDKKDFKGCIAHMRSLLRIYPEFKNVIAEYQQLIKKAAGIGNEDKNSMNTMAVLVKRNIREMISKGEIAAAEKTLGELQKLVPDDAEIPALSTMIEGNR